MRNTGDGHASTRNHRVRVHPTAARGRPGKMAGGIAFHARLHETRLPRDEGAGGMAVAMSFAQ
jgi:hypothetical protein